MKNNITNQEYIIAPRSANGTIYVRQQFGYFQQLRRYIGGILMLAFIVTPWLSINGQQAILLDLDLLQFHVFGMTLFPQDFTLIAGLFMVAAFLLFFITSWLGRIWCGFLCPQTVWMFSYVWVEEKIEGNRNQRKKLDQQAWTIKKATKKLTKHAVWLTIAFFTATSFLAYFAPVRELYTQMTAGKWSGSVSFWVGLFTVCTYGNAGWLREKMCHHMCPYARFQSVMFDSDTLVVAYDEQRGEGRGARKRKYDHQALGLGDCVDCNLCVDVCPVGIDIRDGLQYECIDCGACVDACNQTMKKFKYPQGLISYTSESQLAGEKPNILRPKILGYGLVALLVVSAMIVSVIQTVPIELSVLRDRQALYRINDQDQIENSYQLKILNKSTETQEYRIEIDGMKGIVSSIEHAISLTPGELSSVILTLTANGDIIDNSVTNITINVIYIGKNDISVSQETRFFAP